MSFNMEVAKARQRFNRGTAWIQSPISTIGIIIANIKLFEGAIVSIGIPLKYFWVLYVLSIPSYIFISFVIGYVDDRFGIWRNENDYGWTITPVAMALCNDVKDIKQKMGMEDGKE